MAGSSFTGRTRKRKTSWKVVAADRTAKSLITLGGIGTILAVLGVCVFLVWVVVPLFLPSEVTPEAAVARPATTDAAKPIAVRLDEYRLMAWTCYDDATVRLTRVDDGTVIAERNLFDGERPLCWTFDAAQEGDLEGDLAAFGFADGTVRFATIGFLTEFLSEDGAPTELQALEPGTFAVHEGGVVQRTVENQLRHQRLAIDVKDPVVVAEGVPVRLIDRTEATIGTVVATLSDDGVLRLRRAREKRNLLTDKVTIRLSGGEIAVDGFDASAPPAFLRLNGLATTAILAFPDGRAVRYDTRDVKEPVVAEPLDLLADRGGTISSLAWLLGRTTLLVGTSEGRVDAWFAIRGQDDLRTPDGATFVRAHGLGGGGAAVTAIASSARKRMVATGHADGTIRLHHVTTDQQLAEVAAEGGEPVRALTVAPKDDGLLALTDTKAHRWAVAAPHPEATVAAIFGRVWYEGASGPEHVWQSSSGTDDFEPKLGLMPLIFGTIKATIYTMLFAVPIALLAAIYTSEFLAPKTKARVKPVIELMASLPSVVLGFLAAIIFAPIIEDVVPETLAAFATVPFALLLGAYLWQMLPRSVATRWKERRLWAMLLFLPVGVGLAGLAGPVAESLLFEGDIKGWLDGQKGTGTGGWMFLLLPSSALVVAVVFTRWVNPRFLADAGRWPRAKQARVDLLKFLGGTGATLVLALAVSGLLGSIGWDPRGSYVDTYIQRNALIVGFVMGFAVIPIIYTLAEDALSAVPEHLRAASLAVGATKWQTATSIIIPTAMSGLFSAMMIGLGRAVGETMIVLMAAGNTPVMDWNVFNGFRTLSANIAVELPEAVQNGTIYRMLFLAALTLFVMTFILNTVAEAVRLRFRKRAYEL